VSDIDRCRPVITDADMPEDGERCMIYEDGQGTAWFLVNRAHLHSDPEGVFRDMVEHWDGLARAFECKLIPQRLSA
jgi:hypothetical protein